MADQSAGQQCRRPMLKSGVSPHAALATGSVGSLASSVIPDLGDERALRFLHGLAVFGRAFRVRRGVRRPSRTVCRWHAREVPMRSKSTSIFAIGASRLFFATGKVRDRPAEPGLIHRLRFANRRSQSRNAASQFAPQSRPPIIAGTTLEEGWAMNEQEDRLAREREEIAARVASFKATQQKFEREREEYYATTLGNAWSGFNRPSF